MWIIAIIYLVPEYMGNVCKGTGRTITMRSSGALWGETRKRLKDRLGRAVGVLKAAAKEAVKRK